MIAFRNLIQALVLATAIPGFAELAWTLRNPAMTNQPFGQVVWTGNQFLALGDGVLATSMDGNSWSSSRAPLATFTEAASSGTVTVAIGSHLVTSSDGAKWDTISLPQTWCCFSSVAWTGSRFVLSGIFAGIDSVATSVDGKNWSLSFLGGNTAGLPHRFATGPSSVLLYGSQGIFRSSPDGRSWMPCSTAKSSVGVFWTGSQFMSQTDAGGLQTSDSGMTWRDRQDLSDSIQNLSGQPETWFDIGSVGGKSYMVGRNAYLSADGEHWAVDSAFLAWWLIQRSSHSVRRLGIEPIHGKQFLLGSAGSIWSGTSTTDWMLRTGTITLQNLRSVAAGQGIWVAVGDSGVILRSVDGKFWERSASPTSSVLRKVLWTGKVFKAIGDSGVYLSSVDGKQWERSKIGNGLTLLDAVWSDTLKLVIADSCRVLRSTDGIQWTSHKLADGAGGLMRIAAGAGRYVVVGIHNMSFSSSNGADWEDNESHASFGTAQSLLWTGSVFLVGGEGIVETSLDGLTWKGSYNPIPQAYFLQMLGYGADRLAMGSDGSVYKVIGDTAMQTLGGPSNGSFSMALSDSLWVQVGVNGIIQSVPAPFPPSVSLKRSNKRLPLVRWRGDRLVIELSGQNVVQLEAVSLAGRRLFGRTSQVLEAGPHELDLSAWKGFRFLRIKVGKEAWQTLPAPVMH